MSLSVIQYLLGTVAGGAVGFILGVGGGGGSILAVPLMVYLVGIRDPHIAIGTSALAVAANAAINLGSHGRRRNVKWSCAGLFAAVGAAGAWGGSLLGKALDGQKLLALFALLMLTVAALMLRSRNYQGNAAVTLNRGNAPKLVVSGGAAGLLSGFFGIGGGFLVVPGLIISTGMPTLFAIGSSLVAVTAFGLTTALSYAYSGLVIWPLAAVFIGGGAAGGVLGTRLAGHLATRRGTLNTVLATVIGLVACYILYRSGIELRLF